MKTILILLICGIAAQTAFAQQKRSVAVLPSDAAALSSAEAEALTAKIRGAALKALPKASFTLLTEDVVIKRLGGAENYVKECIEGTCIADLGKKAQADYIARASAGKLGKNIRLYVELYDVNTSGLIGIHDELYDNFNALYNAIDKNIPGMFKEIIGVATSKVETPAAEAPIQNQSGSFTDSRDGKTYKYVKIGSQVWMAENLNYAGDSYLGVCYKDVPEEGVRKPENCKKYGRLYSFDEAVKSACPKGWHLPKYREWKTLFDYAGGEGDPYNYAKKLLTKNIWKEIRRINDKGECKYTERDDRGRPIEYDYCPTDEYGFNALPGVSCSWGNSNNCYTNEAVWWSSDYHRPFIIEGTANYYGLNSVRCVKD